MSDAAMHTFLFGCSGVCLILGLCVFAHLLERIHRLEQKVWRLEMVEESIVKKIGPVVQEEQM